MASKPVRDIAKMIDSKGSMLPPQRKPFGKALDIKSAASKVYPENYGGIRAVVQK